MAKIIQHYSDIVNIYMDNTNQQTQITIADLDALKNIVDLASARGAFRGAELTQVGVIYDKLNTFLAQVIAQAQQDAESAEPTDETRR
jgi:hypothetical protein